ncbi:hypothetical protein ACOSQ4_005519 [Xanthoceras sorbifolium]
MPHLLVLIPFGRAGGSYLLPSFVLVPVRVGGLFLALGLLSRPVAAAASVKARFERNICGAVPVPFGSFGYVNIEMDIGGWYTSWVLLSSTAPLLIAIDDIHVPPLGFVQRLGDTYLLRIRPGGWEPRTFLRIRSWDRELCTSLGSVPTVLE